MWRAWRTTRVTGALALVMALLVLEVATRPAVAAQSSGDPHGLIAYIGEGRHSIWSILADGTEHQLWLESPDTIQDIAWSPDGTTLAYVTLGNAVGLLRVPSGVVDVIPTSSPIRGPIAFFPDGMNLVAVNGVQNDSPVCPYGELVAVSLYDGLVTPLLSTGCRFSNLAVYPDGVSVLVTSNGSDPTSIVSRVDLLSLEETPLTGIFSTGLQHWSFWNAVLAPDGTKIAFNDLLLSAEPGKGSLWVANPDGSDPWLTRVDEWPGCCEALSFSPNGSWLVVALSGELAGAPEGPANDTLWAINADFDSQGIDCVQAPCVADPRLIAADLDLYEVAWQPQPLPPDAAP